MFARALPLWKAQQRQPTTPLRQLQKSRHSGKLLAVTLFKIVCLLQSSSGMATGGRISEQLVDTLYPILESQTLRSHNIGTMLAIANRRAWKEGDLTKTAGHQRQPPIVHQRFRGNRQSLVQQRTIEENGAPRHHIGENKLLGCRTQRA